MSVYSNLSSWCIYRWFKVQELTCLPRLYGQTLLAQDVFFSPCNIESVDNCIIIIPKLGTIQWHAVCFKYLVYTIKVNVTEMRFNHIYFTIEGTQTILYLMHRIILSNNIAKMFIMLIIKLNMRYMYTRSGVDRLKNNSLLLDELNITS